MSDTTQCFESDSIGIGLTGLCDILTDLEEIAQGSHYSIQEPIVGTEFIRVEVIDEYRKPILFKEVIGFCLVAQLFHVYANEEQHFWSDLA